MCAAVNWAVAGQSAGSDHDSQSVNNAEKGRAIDPGGYDAGKKIKSKKLLCAIVHAADIEDRDGGCCSFVRASESFTGASSRMSSSIRSAVLIPRGNFPCRLDSSLGPTR